LTYRTGFTGLTRDLNRAAVLRLIGAEGPIARNEVAQRLGLSPATVTSITRELLDRGLVRVADRAPSRGGRPALLLQLVGGAATAFGAKVAPDHVVGVRVNLDGDALETFEQKLDLAKSASPEHIAEVLAKWVRASDSESPLLGIGLGVPGVVDDAGVVDSPILGWRRAALSDALQERLRVPVVVDNDVNTLAIAERLYGRGHAVDNFVTVTIGRGVGLGIVAGGDIYRGYRGGAGEFGHVTAVEDGPLCTCGKAGCLEALVADPALVAKGCAEGVLSDRDGVDRLIELADAGNAPARRIYSEAGKILGRHVADVVNVLGPQLVLISGEGTRAWVHLEAAFDRSFRSSVFPPLAGVAVEIDPWDDAKWAIGAATLVLRATFAPSFDAAEQETSIRAWLPPEAPTAEVVG